MASTLGTKQNAVVLTRRVSVKRPARLAFVINFKTANALGLAIPLWLLHAPVGRVEFLIWRILVAIAVLGGVYPAWAQPPVASTLPAWMTDLVAGQTDEKSQ